MLPFLFIVIEIFFIEGKGVIFAFILTSSDFFLICFLISVELGLKYPFKYDKSLLLSISFFLIILIVLLLLLLLSVLSLIFITCLFFFLILIFGCFLELILLIVSILLKVLLFLFEEWYDLNHY